LLRELPGESAAMGALEGAAAIPGNGGRPGETQRAKPTLSGADQKPETAAPMNTPSAWMMTL